MAKLRRLPIAEMRNKLKSIGMRVKVVAEGDVKSLNGDDRIAVNVPYAYIKLTKIGGGPITKEMKKDFAGEFEYYPAILIEGQMSKSQPIFDEDQGWYFLWIKRDAFKRLRECVSNYAELLRLGSEVQSNPYYMDAIQEDEFYITLKDFYDELSFKLSYVHNLGEYGSSKMTCFNRIGDSDLDLPLTAMKYQKLPWFVRIWDENASHELKCLAYLVRNSFPEGDRNLLIENDLIELRHDEFLMRTYLEERGEKAW